MNLKDYFKKYKHTSKKGFTIIEVIAVICILAIASTATISIFIAVQNTVSDTGEVTADQFNNGQVERFIRNEFQVASAVDIYEVDGSFLPDGLSAIKNDECMVYDASAKCVYFKRVTDDSGNFSTVLTIDGVDKVNIQLSPLDTTSTDPTGSKFKMVYNFESKNFTYSGGIVLGNTTVAEGGNMNNYKGTLGGSDTVNLTWDTDDSESQNGLLIKFHSEVPYSESSLTPP